MNKMNIDTIIGKTEQEGINFLQDENIKYRVVRSDSDYYIVTCDFCPERVNLELDNGVITSYHKG